eukprot:gene19043-6370_t
MLAVRTYVLLSLCLHPCPQHASAVVSNKSGQKEVKQ